MKKVCLLFAVLVFGASSFTTLSAGSKYPTQLVSYGSDAAVIRVGTLYHKLKWNRESGSKGSITDTLFYYTTPQNASYYDDYLASHQGMGADPGDTCINRFTLLAPGRVTQFFMQNETIGNATLNLWTSALDADGYLQFPGSENLQQRLPEPVIQTCLPQDPSDQFVTKKWQPEWNVFDFVGHFGHAIELDSTQLDFWIGYALDATGGPTIWQDGVFHDIYEEGECRSFSTLHSECSDGTGCWYRNTAAGDNSRWVAHLMQIEVEYDALPPIITDVSYFADTFEASKVVQASVIEMEGQTFEVALKYRFGRSGTEQTLSMDHAGDQMYQGELTPSVGDTVYYHVYAEDQSGAHSRSPEYSFVRLSQPSGKTLLLVDDTNGFAIDQYRRALNALGVDYYEWTTHEHRGIDASVVNYYGFQTLLIVGLGSTIVPIRNAEEEDIYGIVPFLSSGGNLMLVDMDYFYGWGMPVTGSFAAGDFAFDYLGIGDYENDPAQGSVGTADLRMVGAAGDTVTSIFSAPGSYGPLLFDDPDSVWMNWSDYIEPYGSGIGIFEGLPSSRGMANRKEGTNWKTAIFTFPIELATDVAQFDTLLARSLRWFGDGKRAVSVDREDANPRVWRLLQNYPNPFNAGTLIEYQLPSRVTVDLTIFDVRGKQVRRLVDRTESAGNYRVYWDGLDEQGNPVATGIYLYRLESGSFSQIKKMLFCK